MTLPTFSKNQERILWWLGCIIFMVWAIPGVFPLVSYEADSMHVIAGCSDVVNEGSSMVSPRYSYAYDMQPLVSGAIVGMKYILPFATCEQIYCFITAIAAFMLCIGCFKFVRTLTGINRWDILLSLFLIPESYACAYYPNSSTIAGCLMVWGFCELLVKRNWSAILLLSIAPACRVDVLIVYPVILPLFLYRGDSLRQSIFSSLVYGAIVVSISCILFYLLNANPLESLTGYEDMNESQAYSTGVLYAIMTFYTLPGLLLLIIGLVQILKKKEYLVLAVILVPTLLLHYLFRNTGCATKHYLYLLPFALIAIVRGLYAIGTWKSKWLRYGVVALYAVYLTIGVSADIKSSPWRNSKD